MWLALSGIAGYVLGDTFLFQAFVWIGPRISMLMMSLAPTVAAVIAWVFLGEILTGVQLLAILITLLGVVWVVLEKDNRPERDNKNYFRGVLFGLGGATGQAVGVVLAKNGMAGTFSPISGNFMRMSTALIVMWAMKKSRTLQKNITTFFHRIFVRGRTPRKFSAVCFCTFSSSCGVCSATIVLLSLNDSNVFLDCPQGYK